MMRAKTAQGALCWLTLITAFAAAPVAADDTQASLETLLRQNRTLHDEMQALRGEVQRARDDARAARDTAEAAERSAGAGGSNVTPYPAQAMRDDAILSQGFGPANFQLLDVSLNTLFSGGGSSANDDDLSRLQAGEHDPRQRGFNLQQVELSFLGAVDPYLTGEAHLVYFLDAEGESKFEIEEAFLTTQMLPFGIEEHGFQIEAGHFFTEFGRSNPQHPHQWNWQDQPIVNSRFFGGDGARAPGFRIGWLTPLPWFSEVHFGMQNAKGETMVSFLANDEVFEERAIGGRPFGEPEVDGLDDFTYLMRWVNGFDVSETVNAQLGHSALYGPNGTGSGGDTWVVGSDLVVKWRPLSTHRGWPFVTWQTEFDWRRYEADANADFGLSRRSFQDWGMYTELLWGFIRNWAVGARYELVNGSGNSFDCDDTTSTCETISHNDDPFRDRRHRFSPLLVFHPSEFSRLRLQYNYDRVQHLADGNVHTLWAGVEFNFGAHGAHSY